MNSAELLSILIELSRSDSYFDQLELTYLLNVGQQLSMDNELVEKMIKESTKHDIKIPESEQERMSIIYYMLFLMKIDTIVSDEEKDLVHHYGFKFGFSKPMMDEFISLIESHKFKRLPPDSMLKIVKKYQN